MRSEHLGRVYTDGEVIIREGEEGNCMYVIQKGKVEIIRECENQEILINTLGANDFFGEMAIFDKDVRSATVRSIGESYILTVDRKNFLRRISEDPSMAFRIVEIMTGRIRDLLAKVTELESQK